MFSGSQFVKSWRMWKWVFKIRTIIRQYFVSITVEFRDSSDSSDTCNETENDNSDDADNTPYNDE